MSLLVGIWVPEQINRKEKWCTLGVWGGDEVERKTGSWMIEKSVLRVWGNPILLESQLTLFPRSKRAPPFICE